MDGFEKLIYRNNVFLEKSLVAIKPILTRPGTSNLQELRLVNCVTTPLIIEELLDFILSERVRLRTIGLVQLRMNSLAI